jgi:hypothetical protein
LPFDTSQEIEDQSRPRGLTAEKKNTHENQITSLSANVWEFAERLKMFYSVVLIK